MLFGFIEWVVRATRLSACLALALIAAFVCARWSVAQTAGKPPSQQKAAQSNVAMDQLVAFVTHLQVTGQTNTQRLFDDYLRASLAQQHSADLGVTAWILLRLREGRTNEAIRLLEMRLRSDAVGFADSYRKLPSPLREQFSLTPLGHARDYCKQYQLKSNDAEIAQMEASVFGLLEEKKPD